MSDQQIGRLYEILADSQTDKGVFAKLFKGVSIKEVKGLIKFKATNRLLFYTFDRMITSHIILNNEDRYQKIIQECECWSDRGRIIKAGNLSGAGKGVKRFGSFKEVYQHIDDILNN